MLNDSKVFPARLYGQRAGVRALRVGKKNPARKQHLKGQVEVFLLRLQPGDARLWQALVRPGRKMHLGERVRLGEGLEAEVVVRGELGGAYPAPRLRGRLVRDPRPPQAHAAATVHQARG